MKARLIFHQLAFFVFLDILHKKGVDKMFIHDAPTWLNVTGWVVILIGFVWISHQTDKSILSDWRDDS